MKHSQSMPRVMDGNNSMNSNYSIRTSMLVSLNAKDSIPEHFRKQIWFTQLEFAESFRKIWEDIKRLSTTQKGILSYSNFETLFKNYKGLIVQILRIHEPKDLFEALDEDNDGFLNEDEQVLLFSIFKSEMLRCSQKLLLVFDYKRFYELMVCVRNLEQAINSYQDTLRTNIYEGEIRKYREVGHEKLDDFLERYTQRFEEFQELKRRRIEQFQVERQEKKENLEQEITSDTHMVKFKPKKELKDYLTNEKLVALEERIEEAANFRKELEKISAKESVRLRKNMDEYIRSKLHAFDLETERLLKHLNVKIDNDENKLKIRMAKEFDVLIKKIALHENDIKRIQIMSKKKALLRGKNQGELIRLKQTLRKQNDIIKNAKNKAADGGQDTKGFGNTHSSSSRKNDEMENRLNGSKFPSLVLERPKAGVKQVQELKRGQDLIRFYIKQKFGADIPVNAKLESYQQGDDQHHKIEKYLKGKTKADEDSIYLARLYDDNLNEVPEVKYGDSLVDKSKHVQNETRTRITEMLNVHSRYK